MELRSHYLQPSMGCLQCKLLSSMKIHGNFTHNYIIFHEYLFIKPSIYDCEQHVRSSVHFCACYVLYVYFSFWDDIGRAIKTKFIITPSLVGNETYFAIGTSVCLCVCMSPREHEAHVQAASNFQCMLPV